MKKVAFSLVSVLLVLVLIACTDNPSDISNSASGSDASGVTSESYPEQSEEISEEQSAQVSDKPTEPSNEVSEEVSEEVSAEASENESAEVSEVSAEVSEEVSEEKPPETSEEESSEPEYELNYAIDDNGAASYATAHTYVFKIDGFNQSVENVAETTRICTSMEDIGTNWSIYVILDKVSENVYRAASDGLYTAGEPMPEKLKAGQIVFSAHSASSRPRDAVVYPNWQDKVALLAVRKGDTFTFSGVDFANRLTDNATVRITAEDVPPPLPKPGEFGEAPQSVVYLPTGYFLYNGAAYSQSFYNHSVSLQYADVYAQYANLFPDTRVSVVTPPINSIVVRDEEINKKISSQEKVLDNMEKTIHGGVSFVNLKNAFIEHSDEYLYFKSDHHWTHLGAYYAYCEYAKSIGLTPVELSVFETKIVGEKFNGSAAYYSQDDRPLQYIDTVTAYMPTKQHTMRIYRDDGSYAEYDSSIIPNMNYVSFICGDNKLTVINVPENDQDKTILVIKDSYANAFITYLTEHYGTIYVLDPRHTMLNVPEVFGDKGLDDIVFMANTSTMGGSGYLNYYKKLLQ